MTRRTYTGTRPVVFMTGGVGPVQPGGEFTVPDEYAARFDARADVANPAGGTPEDDAQGAAPAGPGRRRRRQDADGSSGESDPASPGSSEA